MAKRQSIVVHEALPIAASRINSITALSIEMSSKYSAATAGDSIETVWNLWLEIRKEQLTAQLRMVNILQ